MTSRLTRRERAPCVPAAELGLRRSGVPRRSPAAGGVRSQALRVPPRHLHVPLPRETAPTEPSYALVCKFCGREAQGIAFSTRSLDQGGRALEAPVMVCDQCHAHESAHPGTAQPGPYSGGVPDARVGYLPFPRIQALTKPGLVRLYSLRKLEVNQLRHPRWRKTLWRIWFLGRPVVPES